MPNAEGPERRTEAPPPGASTKGAGVCSRTLHGLGSSEESLGEVDGLLHDLGLAMQVKEVTRLLGRSGCPPAPAYLYH
jgi:hypothetical protein